MRLIGSTCLAVGAFTALALCAASADSWRGYDDDGPAYNEVAPGPVIIGGAYDAYDSVAPAPLYGYGRPAWRDGRYYSYGASRANPSVSPNGWDQDNPRDQQLQGHN